MTESGAGTPTGWWGAVSRALFPGSKAVWRIGGVFVLAGFLVLAWLVFKPRDFVTGSTNTYTRSAVVALDAGSRLCLPGLQIPSGTRRIQVDLGGAVQAQPAADVSVSVETGERTSTRIAARPTPQFARSTAQVPDFTRNARGRLSNRATVCVRSLGSGLTIGGMVGVAADQPPPTVDGKDLNARVAAWFLPAVGERRSLAQLFSQVAQRAALFRPAPVGPWLYWLILLGLPPAMAWLALRALADPRSRQALVSVALVGLLSGASWALITSPFDAPDESEHFAALQYVAETGNQVDRVVGTRSPYSTQQVQLLEALRHFSTIESSDGKKPWRPSQSEIFREQEARGPPADDGGGGTVTTSAGNTAYYVLVAPSYLMAKGEGILTTVLAGRLTSTLLLLVIGFCAFGTVRELLPRRPRLAIGAALLVILAPVLSFMGGAINTDMGVNAADALLIFLVIRAMRRGATPVLMGAISLLAVVAVLLKATAFALFPALALGVAVALLRAGRSAYAGLAALAVGLGLGMALKYSIETFLGRPAAGAGVPAAGPPTTVALKPGAVLSYAWQTFFPRLPGMADHWIQKWPFFDIYVRRGFTAFGWYAYELPRFVSTAVAAGLGGVVGCGIFSALTRRDGVWRYKWEITVLLLVLAGVLGGVAAAYYVDTPRPVPGEQGRYAFPAAVAVATLSVGALVGFGPRTRQWLLIGFVAALGTLGMMGRLAYLAGAYS